MQQWVWEALGEMLSEWLFADESAQYEVVAMYAIVYPIKFRLWRWEIHCSKCRALIRCGTARTMFAADREAYQFQRKYAQPS